MSNIMSALEEDGDILKAMNIYSELRNSSEWEKHKDWMKGFKYILNLAKKYFFT